MNIFVGNLDYGATESSVRELFEPYGAVDAVRIMTDRETGRSRGFGFVEMPNESEANSAMSALNGKNVGGRPLVVNEARPKPAGGFGGGGGGFGGGAGRRSGGGGGAGGGGGYGRRREPRW
jgi:RNA recognition motif-containing protein